MKQDADAARARAEAVFKKADQPGRESAATQEEQAIRDRTAKLRAQRLAKEEKSQS